MLHPVSNYYIHIYNVLILKIITIINKEIFGGRIGPYSQAINRNLVNYCGLQVKMLRSTPSL
jgi:hypothetical protein